MTPPDRFATVAVEAGRALEVEITAYLVDYEQQHLHPVPGPHTAGREPLGVDSSLAGRSFRDLDIMPTSGADPRLWVPLLDGVERLGVLEVGLGDPGRQDDAELRSHLVWLAALLGHLVSVMTHYGDGLDAVRRQRPRSTAAELIWQLLPPLTAGTDDVVVAGLVEPCYDTGGDAFDYALSATTAHLAIFDATGHTLDSGLTTAMALSADRRARRDGATLLDRVRAIDEVIGADADGAGRMLTAVLAELDLGTGLLRYVAAGHPYPLLVRDGKVVKSLSDGRRPLFGLPAGELVEGTEQLEPGDWLVLYTDGITEARDENGGFFGLDRLEDFMEREIRSGLAPPEMVRRLVANVLSHQRGVLQDDASIVVAQWAHLYAELTP
ncbi:PP2C family protein-serine/threonine phosphatase [Georgenia sp. 10Sc9-8]|uniref:PP2C family protein-serine/threonine phosphatase n=1 Tax=Georgenia halotolerans TaxID=3028317 RepID=A0ABT5U1N7_9MICO|nr:PP2C family protein-serine/threonine phosphatase [Georgenia halotolerans]